jgi:hypothetical protein
MNASMIEQDHRYGNHLTIQFACTADCSFNAEGMMCKFQEFVRLFESVFEALPMCLSQAAGRYRKSRLWSLHI